MRRPLHRCVHKRPGPRGGIEKSRPHMGAIPRVVSAGCPRQDIVLLNTSMRHRVQGYFSIATSATVDLAILPPGAIGISSRITSFSGRSSRVIDDARIHVVSSSSVSSE